MIRGLHHNAYRCRDSEETRAFYEGFLGLPLAETVPIGRTRTQALHTFYRMDDGSFLAFFEEPGAPFAFKKQRDFDLHIALEVSPEDLRAMCAKGRKRGIDTRGPTDHGAIESIYFRDPNGYVVELCAKKPANGAVGADPSRAREALDAWQAAKAP